MSGLRNNFSDVFSHNFHTQLVADLELFSKVFQSYRRMGGSWQVTSNTILISDVLGKITESAKKFNSGNTVTQVMASWQVDKHFIIH